MYFFCDIPRIQQPGGDRTLWEPPSASHRRMEHRRDNDVSSNRRFLQGGRTTAGEIVRLRQDPNKMEQQKNTAKHCWSAIAQSSSTGRISANRTLAIRKATSPSRNESSNRSWKVERQNAKYMKDSSVTGKMASNWTAISAAFAISSDSFSCNEGR